MEPISLALTLLMNNPTTVVNGVQQATKPAVIDVTKMQASFADLSKEVLLCYHKSARFRSADKLQQPWERQTQYAAENSAVVRIKYTGVSSAKYQMDVAVMVKSGKVRTAVINDSAVIPYNKRCQLEEWTGAPAPSADQKKSKE